MLLRRLVRPVRPSSTATFAALTSSAVAAARPINLRTAAFITAARDAQADDKRSRCCCCASGRASTAATIAAAGRCNHPARRHLSTSAASAATSHPPAAAATAASSAASASPSSTSSAASPSSASPGASPSSPSYDPVALQQSGLLRELHERGMIAAITHPAELSRWLSGGNGGGNGDARTDPSLRRVVYAGFDPTARSLHIGNLLVLMILRRFQAWGHKPLCVVGGATGLIGDPSGRSSERKFLDHDALQQNIQGITADIRKFLVFEDEQTTVATPSSVTSADAASSSFPPVPSHARALLLNNVDWFGSMSLLPFLRDVGRHFRLGTMLGKESVSSRMKASSSSANGAESQGMSFTEFCYQVLQGYDFLHLHRERQCSIQVGGSDQWGNITAGVELAQRDFAASPAAASNSNSQPPQVFGLTLPLLTTADGQKFGKSTGAPIWLAAPPKSSGNGGAQHSQSQPQQQQCSSPYELYQFFLTRTADADLGRFLRLFTDYSLDQIRAWEAEYLHCSAPNPKALARILAEAVTTLVHGAEGLKEAQRATAALFGDGESGGNSGGGNAEQLSALSFDEFQRVFAGVPSVRLGRSSLESSPPLLTELCVLLGAAKTKAEAKRLLAGGGLYLNGSKLLAPVSPSSDAHTTTTAARRLDPQTDLLHQGRALILRAGKKKQFVLFVEDDDKGNASATKSHA